MCPGEPNPEGLQSSEGNWANVRHPLQQSRKQHISIHCTAGHLTSYTARQVIAHHTLHGRSSHITHCTAGHLTSYTARQVISHHTLHGRSSHIIHYTAGHHTSYNSSAQLQYTFVGMDCSRQRTRSSCWLPTKRASTDALPSRLDNFP